jgi:Rab3 GTPase-activating protein non-catalytic subunit
VLGVDTGLVRFFMESGKEIHSQCFHNEPVQSIKSQSGKKVNEEVHISYASCVCILQASLLLPTLISLRQQLKRVRNDAEPVVPPTAVNIPCRKWGFVEKNATVVDNVVVGSQKTCSFDHLLTASLDSFAAKYRNAPPQHSLVIGCGVKPYVTFNYATEGFVQPVLKDVAKAVASKIITWFSSSPSSAPAQTNDPATVAQIPSEPMICRFGLCDATRTAYGIWMAPVCENSDVQLAVVTDNLGRVVLLDCEKGIALRMWKGYRDAQVSFIKAREKLSKNADKRDQRSAVFLIIYAPRRASIEIWPLQSGHKIATFHASKRGQLIYVPHNVMGASVHNEKLKYSNNTCIFFDPHERLIKEITIPFHCALSDSNSKTAKDLHLLKRLKTLLKSRTDGDEEQFQQEVTNLCQGLQTEEMKQHCLDFFVKNRKTSPKMFENALRALHTGDALNLQIENYLRLVKFFNYLTTSDSTEHDCSPEPVPLADNELVTIQKLLDLTAVGPNSPTTATAGPKVKFEVQEVDANHFMDYLAAWSVSATTEIGLKADCKLEIAAIAGEIIFKRFLDGQKPLVDFVKQAADVRIPCEHFLKLFLNCWLKQPCRARTSDAVVAELSRFNATLIQICVLAGEKVHYDNATVCRWWQMMREFFLVGNRCPLRSLLAAMVCRHVGVKYQVRVEKSD